ncbi:MAG: hypothetical protein PWR06_2013 [Thermoanaerobacteraceae bacterium]|nr:hypothetical protein [Thermoanaerobacteraceae bacterium]
MLREIEAVSVFSDSDEVSSGWLQVLQQEKIPYGCHADLAGRITIFPDKFPEEVYEYVKKGGIAVLEKPGDLSRIDLKRKGEGVISRFYFPLLGDDGITAPAVVDIYEGQGWGHFIVHEERLVKYGMKIGYHPLVLEVPWGQGFFYIISCRLSSLLMYYGDTLRRFSPFTEVTERVTAIDKSKISRVMVAVLKRAFERAGIPYIGLWYYPQDYSTVFMFRIDVDGVEGEITGRISDICEQYGIRTTFYVNMNLCQPEEDCLKKISRFHFIGNHGNIHNVFDTVYGNKDNIVTCERWLEKLFGEKTSLFSAPRGLWNEDLAVALEELGYTSSSDFGFYIDGFPFHPVVRGKPLKILQIPVHPYCVNRAQRYYKEKGLGKVSPEEVIEYYKKIIDHKEKLNEPILIYGHPNGLGYQSHIVLPAIFEYIRQKGIHTTSIPEFSDWWIRRENTKLQVFYDPDEDVYKIDVSDDVSLMIETKEPVKVGIKSRSITVKDRQIITGVMV